MVRVAKFEKVSYEQFKKDWIDTFKNEYTDEAIKQIYDEIELPSRATSGSAGYDFHITLTTVLKPGETIKVPTGIRCYMEKGWVLKGYPKSGLGFKYRAQLDNTVAIVDEDYYYSKNEGHIFAKITNDGWDNKELTLLRGDKFFQGILVQYGITIDDNADGVRDGGFGSTGR